MNFNKFKVRSTRSIYIILSLYCVLHHGQCKEQPQHQPQPQPLILTPFIESLQFQEARQLSLVKIENLNLTYNYSGLPTENILSYSGLLNVDQGCNSNIFFWFFPAMDKPTTAPLILWHGGGPGSSGLSALFTQHGPFLLEEDGSLHLRTLSWIKTHSIIYVDSPVGTGFSDHKDRPECYVRTTTTTGKHMLEAVSQFFKLFPEFSSNDFFIFSGSYGGKFVPAIAYEIHNHNNISNSKINLRGFCIASGFTDPISQINYGDAYYAAGLIDQIEADYFRQREMLAKVNINQGNWSAAFDIIEPLVIGMGNKPSHLRSLTGIDFPLNMAKDWGQDPHQLRRHVAFLNKNDVQNALHVGHKKFTTSNPMVYKNFRQDIYQSVKPIVEELLDSSLYRILIISNQFDLIVPHSTIASFLSSLSWKKRSEFRECRAKKWNWDQDQSQGSEFMTTRGYVRELQDLSLTHLFLRNSGHLWILDQPELAFQVMTRFTGGQSFTK